MWVFGYGSLMWDPGFQFVSRQAGVLRGWHRSFCMRSVHYRGTPEVPGLVLALDAAEGASCAGVLFEVARESSADVLQYLRDRELVTDAYLERNLDVTLPGGGQVTAVTYVIDRDHPQYERGLDLETQAQIIARAVGQAGPNSAYLWNSAGHLAELGLHDADLEWLSSRVRDLKGQLA